MKNINLQVLTKALQGSMDCRWFENDNIGLKRTLFHHITIPLEPFDSGLDYVTQPEKTEIYIDWLELNISENEKPQSFILKKDGEIPYEASIYLGSAHNPIDINKVSVTPTSQNSYSIEGIFSIDFEFENVAKNEIFELKAEVEYKHRT